MLARNAPLRGLRAFCIVARHSSIKHAADELCVTASAVSHQIKDLEKRLGVRLFERRTRLLTITPTGRGLFEEIDPLIRGIDQAARRWARLNDAEALRLRLPAFFASEFFVPKLKEFADSQPGADICIETTESDRGSHHHDADISVVLADRPPLGQNVDPLFGVQLIPATSPGLVRRFRNDWPAFLGHVNLIVHKDDPRAWHRWAREASVEQLEPQRVVHFDSTASVTSAAEKGLGVALVPMPITQARFDIGNLIAVSDKVLDTGDWYYAISDCNSDNRQSLHLLKSWIVAEFGSA